MDVLAHWPEDEYHPHGLDGCTCDAEAEDPHCKFHGYEAVIRRLRRQLEGAVDLIRDLARFADSWPSVGKANGDKVKHYETMQRARDFLGGQS